jgi:two-component system sensor kinase FixL
VEEHKDRLEDLVGERTRQLETANVQLRESEERFRLIVDGAKDHAIFMLDPDGRVVSWNSGAEATKGYTASEIIGHHVSCFYVSEDVEHGEPTRLLKAAAEHGLVESEGWRVRKDGSRFWAEVVVTALRDDSGRLRGFCKVTRDVSVRKQAEESLRQSEERHAAIINSAMDAIITVDNNQRIIVFNAAAEKIFGCPAAEAIGQSLDRFIPERFRGAHRRHVQTFGSTGATSRTMYSPGTLHGRRANGEEFPLEATISQATIGGEKLYTVILRDLTQRKQTEAALMQSEKLATVGRLSAIVAHEINNPLEAVTNLLYLAEQNPSLDEAAREHLRMAGAEVARAAHIARQTLGFTKGGTAFSRFRTTDVLESVLALLERKLRNKEVICEKEFTGQVEIWGVENEIRQIFWNLLSNSLDAVLAGGRIKLRIAPSHRNGGVPGVRVTVADNGSGISADHMPHLFEPFFTTKATGNGLGLWITSEIVKKHGGSIRVRSRNGAGERTGTVFSVFLPAEAANVAEMQVVPIQRQA